MKEIITELEAIVEDLKKPVDEGMSDVKRLEQHLSTTVKHFAALLKQDVKRQFVSISPEIPDADPSQEILDAIARFPGHFGLRNFPGKSFTIGTRQSFKGEDGKIYLYTLLDGIPFAKGTPEELLAEIVFEKVPNPESATSPGPGIDNHPV